MQTCVLQVVFVPLSVGSWIHELVISFDFFLVTGTFLSLSLDHGSGGSWNDELIYLGFSPCSRQAPSYLCLEQMVAVAGMI
jgi:hypothetical protein